MATKVMMEALSPTMEEGRLVKWLKNEGDAVKNGDVLAEVETDKAIMELVARGDGVLRARLVPEDTTKQVRRRLAAQQRRLHQVRRHHLQRATRVKAQCLRRKRITPSRHRRQLHPDSRHRQILRPLPQVRPHRSRARQHREPQVDRHVHRRLRDVSHTNAASRSTR